MSLNRQKVLGEVNPLFKKFVQEGDQPSTYIPAEKRREIYDFMGKTNYTKGVHGKLQKLQIMAWYGESMYLTVSIFCLVNMGQSISTKKEADQKLMSN